VGIEEGRTSNARMAEAVEWIEGRRTGINLQFPN
jgi:hypothetical protein